MCYMLPSASCGQNEYFLNSRKYFKLDVGMDTKTLTFLLPLRASILCTDGENLNIINLAGSFLNNIIRFAVKTGYKSLESSSRGQWRRCDRITQEIIIQAWSLYL